MNVIDSNAQRYPGVCTEYALFFRKASSRDPNGWKLLGKPTTEHDTLRAIAMPETMIDSELYGKNWIDSASDVEYKILERTVTRTQWRTESK